jgi:hypothetical protein
METPDTNPLAGLQSRLVAESPFLEPGRLLESDRVNPAFLPGVRAFQEKSNGALYSLVSSSRGYQSSSYLKLHTEFSCPHPFTSY